jgi:hypothetical protein
MKKLLLALLIVCVLSGVSWAQVEIGIRNPRAGVQLVDEFLGGTATSGRIGDLGWSNNNGTVGANNGEAGEPGYHNLDSTATINTIASIFLSSAVTAGTFVPAENFDSFFRVRPTTTTSQQLRVGFLNSMAAAPPVDGIYMQHDTNDGTNPTKWLCITRAASTQTLTATSTVVTAAVWYMIRIQRVSATQIAFYLNDVLVCTHNTNVPTVALIPGIQIQDLAAASKTMDFGYFLFRISGLTR